jgi:hypothetical protein
MNFHDAWSAFRARTVFLSSSSLVVSAFHTRDGNSQTFHSAAVTEQLATLLLIDLVSLLDEALEAKLGSTKGTFAKKLDEANNRRLLLDFGALDAIRVRRNEAAHEAKGLFFDELEPLVSSVEDQLLDWKLITSRPDYIFAATTPAEWTKGVDAQGQPTFQRMVEIGVVDRVTHAREWGYEVTELRHGTTATHNTYAGQTRWHRIRP